MADKSTTDWLGAVIAGVSLCLLRAFVIMLLVGLIHSTYRQVPAIGYWVTLAVVVIVDLFSFKLETDKG